jgi:hypothetical protein
MIKQKETKTLFRQDDEIKNMIFNSQVLRATQIVTSKSLLNKNIKRETLQDAQTRCLRQTKNAKDVNELLLYHELIYVSRTIKEKVMQQEHDAITSKHFKVDKTMKRLTQTYY